MTKAGCRLVLTTMDTSEPFSSRLLAYREIKRGGSLVVTYNVNSLNTADVYADVDNYRPRFIVVPRSPLP